MRIGQRKEESCPEMVRRMSWTHLGESDYNARWTDCEESLQVNLDVRNRPD